MDNSQAITTAQPNAAALQTAQVFNSMQALETFGNYIFQSNMFGVRNPAEGFVIGITCQQEGMTLMQFKERYHLIQGQVAMKSEAMLANLLELGGEYEVIERTPERAALKVSYKKATFVSELKWEDAQKEDYTKGRNGQLKDNWSTPRRRMQMMWARAVSDGVRAVCPLATRGHYTPEEAVDFDEPKVVNVTSAAAPAAYPQEEQTASAAPAAYPQEEQTAPAAPAPAPAPAPATAPAAPSEEVLPPHGVVTLPPIATSTPAMFKNDGPADLDYTVCKIDGPMKGIKWSDMNVENLRLALEITNPQLYEQDKTQIRALITQYEAATAGIKGDN